VAIELVFETHSMTVDNEQGHATGWLPGQLSERGRAQARQLGRRRISDGITAVFSSDLARAAQTASVAFGASSIPVLYDWRLRECLRRRLGSGEVLLECLGGAGVADRDGGVAGADAAHDEQRDG
jgi:2,3-bisphosphoglycerate-dependent phosphoglycerate mutase